MCSWKPLSLAGGKMQYSSPAYLVFRPHSSIAIFMPPAGTTIAGGVVLGGTLGDVDGTGGTAADGGVLAGGVLLTGVVFALVAGVELLIGLAAPPAAPAFAGVALGAAGAGVVGAFAALPGAASLAQAASTHTLDAIKILYIES